LSLLSGILLILPFPNYNLWILAWFGFVPLFFALKNKSKGKAFLLSYLTGIIFWFGIIYWLAHVTLAGMIALVLYLALYVGIFGFFLIAIGHRPSAIGLLLIPSFWVLLEYLRSHLFTGFPWALLGYSQYLNLPVIQIADITGAWGVSFLVMMVNVAIYSVVSCQLSVVRKIEKCLVVFLCLLVTLIYGYYKLNHSQLNHYNSPIKISVIQGNISQELKWNEKARDFIMDRYLTLSKQAVKDRPDLIIWPEAALPCILEEEPQYYETTRHFVQGVNTPLLLGAVTLEHGLYYNSALLISPGGQILNQYNKLHLVPFGEYIPLRKTFWFLETIVPIGDFTVGREYTVFKSPVAGRRSPVIFSVLICFEDLFPEISREFVKRGAGFLVNITNDAWFKKTSSPYQHLQASVFRALENRVFLVRAANTGISGFITPRGKIISLLGDKLGNNIFISGYDNEIITASERKPGFYTRHGDVFIFLLFIFIICGIFSLARYARFNQRAK